MVKCYIPNYPRPQFVRKSWVDLCGNWAFRFDDPKILPDEYVWPKLESGSYPYSDFP